MHFCNNCIAILLLLQAQQHAIGSFSKSMANFATGVVDQLWNENIQKRYEVADLLCERRLSRC